MAIDFSNIFHGRRFLYNRFLHGRFLGDTFLDGRFLNDFSRSEYETTRDFEYLP